MELKADLEYAWLCSILINEANLCVYSYTTKKLHIPMPTNWVAVMTYQPGRKTSSKEHESIDRKHSLVQANT